MDPPMTDTFKEIDNIYFTDFQVKNSPLHYLSIVSYGLALYKNHNHSGNGKIPRT
jgi:hypothetical protein